MPYLDTTILVSLARNPMLSWIHVHILFRMLDHRTDVSIRYYVYTPQGFKFGDE